MNHLMTFRLFREHSTLLYSKTLLNYAYFASSREDPPKELLEYNGLVTKNDIFEENILRLTFCRYGPSNWKFPRVRVLEFHQNIIMTMIYNQTMVKFLRLWRFPIGQNFPSLHSFHSNVRGQVCCEIVDFTFAQEISVQKSHDPLSLTCSNHISEPKTNIFEVNVRCARCATFHTTNFEQISHIIVSIVDF